MHLVPVDENNERETNRGPELDKIKKSFAFEFNKSTT